MLSCEVPHSVFGHPMASMDLLGAVVDRLPTIVDTVRVQLLFPCGSNPPPPRPCRPAVGVSGSVCSSCLTPLCRCPSPLRQVIYGSVALTSAVIYGVSFFGIVGTYYRCAAMFVVPAVPAAPAEQHQASA